MASDVDPNAAWVSVILRELEVPVDVSSKGARIAMQKAIYLAQTTGADLGYRFSWYLNGPYSTSLADTYYHLNENFSSYASYEAGPEFKKQLAPIAKLIKARPNHANFNDWLEAVGSLHFMVRVMGREMSVAVERCKYLKPKLAGLLDLAKVELEKSVLK